MKPFPRILFAVGVLFLLALFLFPMWQITLVAPQYPQGVTMYIWINKITGEEPGTIQNINILNHYVGMKYIKQEDFPEFLYFPKVILAVVALGLIFAVIGKRSLFLTWVILMALLAAAGIYDFYLWEYDYGHSLSPTAPMKFPGMAFQPPLIGEKTLLNFIAISWPAIGGWLAGLSIIVAFAAWWISKKKSTHEIIIPDRGTAAAKPADRLLPTA